MELRIHLRKIVCPTLIIHGAESKNFTRADAELTASLVAKSRLTEIPDAGHVVHLANPDGFLAAVYDFLATAVKLQER